MDEDILKAQQRYDELQDEFDLYVHKRGPIKMHSVTYLQWMLGQVDARIKELEAAPDDAYKSISAALIRWRWLRTRIKLRIDLKEGKFR